jgi:hypothetical protein
MRIVYIVLGAGSLALMLLDAPAGSVLTTAPERGKIEAAPPGKPGAAPSARRTFIFVGGGFHGGK